MEQTEAPLNEVLAAGMILKTGWKGESNFVDPMCGSGTLLIEAAMIALNIAPGYPPQGVRFREWIDFDQELFDRIYNDESQEREFTFKCYGSDINPAAIEIAQKNIRSAGLAKYVELKTMPFQQYTEAPQPGILVTNPPYGERISSRDLLGLYNMIGERVKHVFTGYKVWILSYKDECFDKIGLRPSERMKLINGSLDCEYRCYEIFEGKNKDYKKALNEEGAERTEDSASRPRPSFPEKDMTPVLQVARTSRPTAWTAPTVVSPLLTVKTKTNVHPQHRENVSSVKNAVTAVLPANSSEANVVNARFVRFCTKPAKNAPSKCVTKTKTTGSLKTERTSETENAEKAVHSRNHSEEKTTMTLKIKHFLVLCVFALSTSMTLMAQDKQLTLHDLLPGREDTQ